MDEFTKLVVDAKGEPPLDAEYHWIPVPVAVRLATVGTGTAQNICGLVAVGAEGLLLTVAVTVVLEEETQPVVVFLASAK